jgi:hypothetical protein
MYCSLYPVVLAVVLAVPGTSLVNPRNVPCNLRHTTLTAGSELEPCGNIDGKQPHVGRSMSFRRSKYIDMSRPKNASCSPKSDSETTTVRNTMTSKQGEPLSSRLSELLLERAKLQETLETLGRGCSPQRALAQKRSGRMVMITMMNVILITIRIMVLILNKEVRECVLHRVPWSARIAQIQLEH